MGGSTGTEWTNVQDVSLKREGPAFLGQAILKRESGKIGPYFKNFVVQYWMNFADGTSLISPVYSIPVPRAQVTYSWDDDEKARAAVIEDARAQSFWEKTSCQQIGLSLHRPALASWADLCWAIRHGLWYSFNIPQFPKK